MKKSRPFSRISVFLMIFLSLGVCLFTGCSEKKTEDDPDNWMGLRLEETEENRYATGFTIRKYEGGAYRLSVSGANAEYLILPEKAESPANVPSDITVIRQPKQNVYLASSSVMCYFYELGAKETVGFTSTKAGDWTDPEVKKAVEEDEITYVGKYNAPDYEWLVQEKTTLAIENTMILHSPKTKEQLEQLGIPVLVEYSSYEEHPLGRLEWIRVYGCILGKEEAADTFFKEQEELFLKQKKDRTEQPLKVACFSITPNGYVSVQKPGSYMAALIREAGGEYFLTEEASGEEKDSGSLNLQMDRFYETAKDADLLIYNGNIYGVPESLQALVREQPLLADFKAVKNKNVYSVGNDLFQGPTKVARVMEDLSAIMDGTSEETEYFHRLKD